MASNAKHAVYPIATDVFSPHTDLQALAGSLVTPTFVANQAGRDALTPAEGDVVWRQDLHCVETWNGTRWTGAAASFSPVMQPTATPYTAAGQFIQNGKQVTFWFTITLGAAFSMAAGSMTLTLPIAADMTLSGPTAGAVRLFDSSTGFAILGARLAIASSTTLGLQTTATYGSALASVAFNFPWTWAVGDIIDGFITYVAA